MPSMTENFLTVSGIGLITGKPVEVEIQPADPGHGVIFYMEGVSAIPARLSSVVHTDRGVTLADAEGKTISIVEHFLCAVSMAGLSDLKVMVHGAPEMPILDGSAQDWIREFETSWPLQRPEPSVDLPKAIFYRHNEDICVYAIPDTHFKVSYCVDFNHPELRNQWVRWDSREQAAELVSASATFGFLSELPAMQAKGLALGVRPENSLGLIEEGGYSRPLRHDLEPVYHKVLDLIGDLALTGLNPLTLKAHVFAINAGHGSHTAFACKLLKVLQK